MSQIADNTQRSIETISVCGPDEAERTENVNSTWVQAHFVIKCRNGIARRCCKAPECGESFATTTSHCSLKKHWRKSHQESQPVELYQSFSNNLHIDYYIKYIIRDQVEYVQCESKSFKKFCLSMNPNKKMISRGQLSDIINKGIQSYSTPVANKLKDAESVAICFDIWSPTQHDLGYGCITAHYVSRRDELEQLVLDFDVLPYPHDADTVSGFILNALENYDLTRKVISLTMDNASVNYSAVRYIKIDYQESLGADIKFEFTHVPCFAHVINLGVKKCLLLEEIERALHSIREIIKYVRSSGKRNDIFKRKKRSIIEDNGPQLFSEELELIVEVDTRWNSTYLMIERILRLKAAIIELSREPNFTIPSVNWPIIEELCQFLKPFHSMTEKLSGASYATISLAKAMIRPLKDHLKKNYTTPIIKQAAESFATKFDEYEDQFNHESIVVAALLDPRVKCYFLDNQFDYAICLLRKFAEEDLNNSIESNSSITSDLFDDAFVSNHAKDECQVYLELPRETKDCNPVLYWRNNEIRFPKLSKLAKIILPMQATSVACERTFSKASLVYTPLRNKLQPESLRSNIILNSWLDYLDLD